jgi:phosphate starvation-inducible PhoH-like protein
MNDLNRRGFALDPQDNDRLANLCGPFDEHLRQIELRMGVEISHRGNLFQIIGDDGRARAAERLLRKLYDVAADEVLNGAQVNLRLAESGVDALQAEDAEEAQEVAIRV